MSAAAVHKLRCADRLALKVCLADAAPMREFLLLPIAAVGLLILAPLVLVGFAIVAAVLRVGEKHGWARTGGLHQDDLDI